MVSSRFSFFNSSHLKILHLTILIAATMALSTESLARNVEEDFLSQFELDPVQVVGEEIPITVFARTNGDRRYATKLAHSVIETVYDSMGRSPGSGLVIIGESGEPHPIIVLEQFLEIARRDNSPATLRQYAIDLEKIIEDWRNTIKMDPNENNEINIDMNELIHALPLPLKGVAVNLYLIAWEEDFVPKQIEARLKSIDPVQLSTGRLDEFNWVFYLPSRNALNKLLKKILPELMKAGKLGPIKRMMVRGAIAAFKPAINDAMEGVRKGMFYMSVMMERSGYSEEDIELLGEAYIESQMPRGRVIPGDKLDRGLEAVRQQKIKNAEYARDPFIVLEPLPEGSYDPQTYERCLGYFWAEGHAKKRFFFEEGRFYWQEGDQDPIEYLLAKDYFFVSKDKDITIEFFPNSDLSVSSVELRKRRFRFTFPRVEDQ